MSFPPDLLLRLPEEAVRRIVLSLLDEAHAASDRLDDPKDIWPGTVIKIPLWLREE